LPLDLLKLREEGIPPAGPLAQLGGQRRAQVLGRLQITLAAALDLPPQVGQARPEAGNQAGVRLPGGPELAEDLLAQEGQVAGVEELLLELADDDVGQLTLGHRVAPAAGLAVRVVLAADIATVAVLLGAQDLPAVATPRARAGAAVHGVRLAGVHAEQELGEEEVAPPFVWGLTLAVLGPPALDEVPGRAVDQRLVGVPDQDPVGPRL
jgi:hypothetical protein